MAEELSVTIAEDLWVIDPRSRESVPRAADLAARLPGAVATDPWVVTLTGPAATEPADLRAGLLECRRTLLAAAAGLGLAAAAAGSAPLLDPDAPAGDPQAPGGPPPPGGLRVHVGVPGRDAAVTAAARLAPALPVLLALSAGSPFRDGADTGFASSRALLRLHHPAAGDAGDPGDAAGYDALVAGLVAAGVADSPAAVAFDAGPDPDAAAVVLRACDAVADPDTAVLLAVLFRALVRRALREPAPPPVPPPLHRAAMWRAARWGLDGELPGPSGAPGPAADAVRRLVTDLAPDLDDGAAGLAGRVLDRGGPAGRQRRAHERRGRLADVVDLLIAETRGGAAPDAAAPGAPGPLAPYAADGDETFDGGAPVPAYTGIVGALRRLGPAGLRERERDRDAEQRARGVTFRVGGEASTRLMPFDLVPRIVAAGDWARLRPGLVQRVRALDAFVRDVYTGRRAVADGVVPAWVVERSPELRPSGALVGGAGVRTQVAGVDLVRDADGGWQVLEDNLRVPSGIAYALQNRRLSAAVLPELPRPDALLDPESTPALLLTALRESAGPAAGDDPAVVLLSEGPGDSAWFEHRMLAGEMGVPLVRAEDLLVDDGTVWRVHGGHRSRVDVVYLRAGEEHLLHAAGADGRPLGPPLARAVHARAVVLANALGNGVGDDKAVYAFVPDLVRYYLGEEPLLAQVPTYLCGVPEQRAQVLDRLGELVCKPVDGYGGQGVTIGPQAGDEDLAALRRQIEAAPYRWVAQELVHLSTHPVFDGDGLAPRHVDLRAFVFTGERSVVAPAALTRVAPAGSTVVNSSRGGGAKDTWLLGGGS